MPFPSRRGVFGNIWSTALLSSPPHHVPVKTTILTALKHQPLRKIVFWAPGTELLGRRTRWTRGESKKHGRMLLKAPQSFWSSFTPSQSRRVAVYVTSSWHMLINLNHQKTIFFASVLTTNTFLRREMIGCTKIRTDTLEMFKFSRKLSRNYIGWVSRSASVYFTVQLSKTGTAVYKGSSIVPGPMATL